MNLISIIFFSLLLLTPLIMPFFVVIGFSRINRFSDRISDEIDFRYSSSFEEYVKKTKRQIIPYQLNRKKRDIDITASYANLRLSEPWNWDFDSMIVDEK